ncbi:uncharacterized protein RBU33_016293 isoform 2-T2 [Hipposideros larvatus]
MAADGVDERSPLLSAPRSGHVTPTAPPYLPESGPGVDGTEVQHAGKMPTLQKNAGYFSSTSLGVVGQDSKKGLPSQEHLTDTNSVLGTSGGPLRPTGSLLRMG